MNQVTGEYATHSLVMALYLAKAKELLSRSNKYDIHQVPMSENNHADALANLRSLVYHQLQRSIPFKYLKTLSITKQTQEQITAVDERESLMDEILSYIRHGALLDDRELARKIIQKVSRYVIFHDKLCRHSY